MTSSRSSLSRCYRGHAPAPSKQFRQDGQNIVWRTRSSDDRRLMLLQFPAVWLAGGCPQGFSFLSEEIRGDLRPTNVARRQTHTRTHIHTHAAVVSVNSSCFVSLPCRVWDAGQREENLKGLLVKVAFQRGREIAAEKVSCYQSSGHFITQIKMSSARRKMLDFFVFFFAEWF